MAVRTCCVGLVDMVVTCEKYEFRAIKKVKDEGHVLRK